MKTAFVQIWKFARPFKKDLYSAFVFGGVLALLSPLLPFLIQILMAAIEGKEGALLFEKNFLGQYLLEFFNRHQVDLSSQSIVQFCALLIPVYFLIYGTARFFHHYLVKVLGEKILVSMRCQLMNKFLHQDVDFLLRNSETGTGGFLTKVLNDTLVLQITLPYYVDLIREPIVAVGILAGMFYLNWKITLAAFVFLPVFIYIIRRITMNLKSIGYKSQYFLEKVTSTLKNSLDGVRVIQSYNLEDHIDKKFSDELDEYLGQRKKLIKREEISGPINEWVASWLLAGICLIQAHLASRGESDTSTFIAFIVAAGLLEKPVKKTQQALVRLQQNLVSLDRLNEILLSERKVNPNPTGASFDRDWKTLRFQNISYSFGEQVIFRDLNIEVKKGEVIALVGESGSGKTSLMNLLLRFADPDSGEISFDGQNIRRFSLASLRRHIALVSQRVFLFDDTIKANVAMGDLSKDPSAVTKALEMANASSFVKAKAGGEDFSVGELGERLSGGEKQRIGIARAIFKDAPILVLDEATSALDTVSEREVQKGLESLIKGRTAFVIAHRLSTIRSADRILVLKAGEVVEEGSHESLMALNGEYAQLVQMQFGEKPTGISS